MGGLELVPGLEVVGELPLVYARSQKALILADTHLGFEEEVASRGGFIPRFQLRSVLRVLEEAFDSVSADKVVFAGDVKHIFGSLGRIERVELLELLTYVKKRAGSIVVVRGNHDNYLPLMKKWVDFEIVESYLLQPYLVVHGHKQLNEELEKLNWRYLVMGHEHPSIALRDPIGVVGKFSCFLVGELTAPKGRGVVVLPAVGVYQTGSKVTLSRETYLSPILRERVVVETMRPVVVGPDVGVMEFPRLGDLFDMLF